MHKVSCLLRAMPASPLSDVTSFLVPDATLTWTVDVLREAGREGYEAFVLWGGVVHGHQFRVLSSVVPEQNGSKTSDGLLVTVDGPALFRANKYFYEQKHLLGVQVHSHPTNAFHSSTDDSFPLATLDGALSVVVPEFGRDGPHVREGWAYYRLREGEWIQQPSGSGVLCVVE